MPRHSGEGSSLPASPPLAPNHHAQGSTLFLRVRSCPVMLVVGDNAPAEDGVVSEGLSSGWGRDRREGVIGIWSAGSP